MKPSTAIPLGAAVLYTGLTFWSIAYLLRHMGDGGCDGGTCTVALLFVPVIALGYMLLLPAAFWLRAPRSVWGGLGAFVCAVLSLAVAALLGEDDMLTAIATAHRTCALLTLGLILGGFGYMALRPRPVNADETDAA